MKIELTKDIAFNHINTFHDLSDHQKKQLEDYVILILQENLKFNFIGKSTIEKIWDRHILDCAQLIKFIADKNVKFADFGSGCGLPGIVLSILGIKEIHLIDKSYRKAEFMRLAKLISTNKIFVHQAKLEELANNKFDCITSRALAPINKLLEYSIKLLKEDGYCLFLKGKKLPDEISDAKKDFDFDLEKFPSITSNESNIIKITNIKKL